MTNQLNITNFDNFQDEGLAAVLGSTVAPGSGFTGTGTKHYASVKQEGEFVYTTFVVDLTGLTSDAAGDIIGADGGTANCHFGQVDTSVMGTPLYGYMECIEAPATGEPDIDVYSAVEGTGAENAAISSLDETALLEAAADWTINTKKHFSAVPADEEYLYLVSSGGGDTATYTAGIFKIVLVGTTTLPTTIAEN